MLSSIPWWRVRWPSRRNPKTLRWAIPVGTAPPSLPTSCCTPPPLLWHHLICGIKSKADICCPEKMLLSTAGNFTVLVFSKRGTYYAAKKTHHYYCHLQFRGVIYLLKYVLSKLFNYCLCLMSCIIPKSACHKYIFPLNKIKLWAGFHQHESAMNIIIFIVIMITVSHISCIGRWKQDNECWYVSADVITIHIQMTTGCLCSRDPGASYWKIESSR